MAILKRRLDVALAEKYPHLTRNQIQSFILQGKATIDGVKNSKAGSQVSEAHEILLDIDEPKYVSRAGFKLEKALEHFNIDVTGLVALDAGLSTGGFTHCLLQHGIARVYGVDVGTAQVHEKIASDGRVTVMEQTNLRHLDKLPELIDLATLDLSFISLLKVMPAVAKLLKPYAQIITLIKPQFEAEREEVQRGGVIKDDAVHQKVVDKIVEGMKEFGFDSQGVIESPIAGAASGNKEFLAYFVRAA